MVKSTNNELGFMIIINWQSFITVDFYVICANLQCYKYKNLWVKYSTRTVDVYTIETSYV